MHPDKIASIHIAKTPCHPPYGIVVRYTDGRELWDCECSGATEKDVLEAAKVLYPRHKVVMWSDPRHYCN